LLPKRSAVDKKLPSLSSTGVIKSNLNLIHLTENHDNDVGESEPAHSTSHEELDEIASKSSQINKAGPASSVVVNHA
jgi:hypothetical protein